MHDRLLGELSTLALTLLLGSALLVACGGDSGRPPVTISPLASTPSTEQIASATPVAAAPADTVERALVYIEERVTVLSGEPEVAFSRRVMDGELNALGIGAWSFEPGCAIPMDVVIIRGDLDVRGAWPMSIPAGTPVATRYLVLVYDARLAEPIASFGDPTGGLVQQALNEQPAASPDFGLSPPVFPEPIPCDIGG